MTLSVLKNPQKKSARGILGTFKIYQFSSLLMPSFAGIKYKFDEGAELSEQINF